MEKPLDNKLSSRIKQVFDDFEDPGADAGWQQLREKYPANRRPLIWWMSSAAAIFVLAAGLWFMDQPEQTNALKSPKESNEVQNMGTLPDNKSDLNDTSEILKEGIGLNQQKDSPGFTAKAIRHHGSVQPNSLLTAKDPALVAEKEIPLEKIALKVSSEEIGPVKEHALAFKKYDLSTPLPTGAAKKLEPGKALHSEITSKDVSGLVKLPNDSTLAAIMAKNEKVSAKPTEKDLSRLTSPATESPLVFKKEDQFTSSDVPPVKKKMTSDSNDPVTASEDSKVNKAETTKKKLAYSVFAGSFYNYSEGSENQLNFGAGFASDIRLGKRLQLSTGISIASNSLQFSGSETSNLPQSASASLSTAGPPYNDASTLTTITGYNARLLALDVPVNLKYQLNRESDKFYLSAGFSSGTYFNEIYDYRYRRFNAVQGSYVSETQVQKITEKLNDFDFARTLNFSAGFSTGFGKKQSISVEPFVKYPLGGLGSQNLKFGSTGINLKLRFMPLTK